MEYFWYQQDDIPAGVGYPLFGKEHVLSVLVTVSLVVFFYKLFFGCPEKKQRNLLKAIPLFMVLLELFKDGLLIKLGRFDTGYLPLHVCSLGVFIFLFREFLPWKKAKDFLGEVAFVLIMPGSAAALLFADWTEYYPVLNFINLHSYVWHGLLVLYPLLIKKRGEVRLSFAHIYRVPLFLLVTVPPIYVFDKIFDRNYFFVNWPVPNSPLSLMEKYMGNPGYLAGYALLALFVISAVYLADLAVNRIKGR